MTLRLVCRKTFIIPALLTALLALFLRDYHSLDFSPASLRHKRVLVTGASRGIGRQVALHYAKLGAKIVITARDEAALLKVKAECLRAAEEARRREDGEGDAADASSTTSPSVFHLVADQEKMTLENARKLVATAVRLLRDRSVGSDTRDRSWKDDGDGTSLLGGGSGGDDVAGNDASDNNDDYLNHRGLDILFLNHAVSTLGFWVGSDANVTSASRAINVNYLSYVALFSAAQPYLTASGGSVVAVSSATARWPMPSVAHYGSSKAAMDSFFRAVDWELRLKESDLSVTVCVLGLVKTKRYVDNMSAFNPNGRDTIAFTLGADPSEAALFMIKGAALRKRQIRYPLSQFILGDIVEMLPAPLKMLAMKKTLPMIND